MFNATNQNQQFVPNKTVRVMPDAQVDYGPEVNNQVKIHIPSYIGFLDPKNTKLNMKISMQGRGSLHPDGSAGMWSLCRDLRVTSGDGRAQLEDIQDLNVLTAQAWSFDENDSLNAKRELLEGSSKNGDLDAQLYWAKKADPFVAAVTEQPKAIQVQCSGVVPMSGIVGAQADNVFPLAATSGLRLQLNLETLKRGCTLATTTCTATAPDNVRGGAVGQVGAAAIPSSSAALLFGTKAPADDDPAASPTATVFVATKKDRDLTTAAANANVAKYSAINAHDNVGFEIGDILYISAFNGTNCMSLGVITQLSSASANDSAGNPQDRLEITYEINRANGANIGTVNGGNTYQGINGTTAADGDAVVFFDPTDRLKNITITHPVARSLEGNSYIIQDVSMSVLQVDPPEGYVDAMMSQVNGKGLNLDYCTSRLYRENIANPIGLQSVNIPANAQRAYSLLSVPLLQSSVTSTTVSSLLGVYETDGAQLEGMVNYQWVFDGNTVPDRPVDLTKYRYLKNAILHITELEKAVENAKIPVRNLWNIQQRFMIARALSRYGQVHDLSGTSSQLRIDYGNVAVDATMVETFCVALNRLVVTAMGIEVIH